ncbi:hypothetical protein ROZALSC1DRAFT_30725 [Rozella allomycis CSF55]|uniref:Uncharacterized protein n=1 Tax=Rozella allomycis (strain CSF55) TaxID=988480 RepID=A0A4P9YE81_ROZAC|nr:hypothetical protein ROZALSC1DRAFT_30725 [Rozella allomycis CSF55]
MTSAENAHNNCILQLKSFAFDSGIILVSQGRDSYIHQWLFNFNESNILKNTDSEVNLKACRSVSVQNFSFCRMEIMRRPSNELIGLLPEENNILIFNLTSNERIDVILTNEKTNGSLMCLIPLKVESHSILLASGHESGSISVYCYNFLLLMSIASLGNAIVTTSVDNILYMLQFSDLTDGSKTELEYEKYNCKLPSHGVNHVCVNSDVKMMSVSSWDCSRSLRLKKTLSLHRDSIYCSIFFQNAEKDFLAVSSKDGLISLWDLTK